MLLIFLGAGVFTCQAQQQRCSWADANQKEREVGRVRSWNALYQSYRRFAPCPDDGELAEGYDEVVARLLLDHWDSLPQLAVLVKKDPRFKAFALRHVSLTALDTNDLTKLRTKAVKHCPVGHDDLCKDLRRRVEYDLSQ